MYNICINMCLKEMTPLEYSRPYRSYTTVLTKTTVVQNDVALSYRRVCGLYFRAVVFAATIVIYSHLSTKYIYIIISVFINIYILK